MRSSTEIGAWSYNGIVIAGEATARKVGRSIESRGDKCGIRSLEFNGYKAGIAIQSSSIYPRSCGGRKIRPKPYSQKKGSGSQT